MPLISSKCKRLIDTNRFAIYTVFGVMAGTFTGALLKNQFWSGQKIDHQLHRYVALPGVIYMRLFILIIGPLLMTSLSLSFLPLKTENPFDKLRRFNESKQSQQSSTQQSPTNINNYHNNNSKNNINNNNNFFQVRNIRKRKRLTDKIDAQKLLMVTFIMFAAFSLFASIFGACLMLTFGSFAYDHNDTDQDISINNDNVTDHSQIIVIDQETIKNKKNLIIHKYYQHDTIYNIFLNIFPNNALTPSFMSSYSKTKIIWPQNLTLLMDANYQIQTQNEKLINYKVNMLSLCILSLCLGIILQKLGPSRTKHIRALLYDLDNVIKYVLQALMKLLPIGMFCWMLAESIKVNSMLEMAVKLAYFYLIVIAAFLFWLLVFYPVVYVIFTRQNPFKLYKNILSAIVIAFGSCSSAITLPETMRCMREKCHLSNRICQTVLPLGMTVHMNGPAMYFPMTAIFVAYIKQCPVGFYSVIVLCLFAVIMSMGVPPVIGTGTTMLNHMAVASVLGVDNPQDILAYVLAFEWMMERIRTSTNIIGDCFAAKCIERILNVQDDDLDDDQNCVEVESEEKL